MRFSTYLTESKGRTNEATLVLHKIISMVDNAHVDVSENDIRFAIGPMIHKGAYNSLFVVVRKGDSGVRLGKFRSGTGAAIVVGVDSLPDRKNIDTLLSKTHVFDGFIKAFVEYLEVLHDNDAEYDKHADEIASENTGNFEENYGELISEFNENVEKYKKAREDVDTQSNSTANLLKKESGKLSITQLQKEYIGNTEAEFLAIVRNLPSYKKFETVDKELRSKLESRLKTYYTGNVKALLQ